jgi:hypothetical protein
VEEICHKAAGLAIDFLEAGLDVQEFGGSAEIGGGRLRLVFSKLT